MKPILELSSISRACAYCGALDNLTKEHVIPRSFGSSEGRDHRWIVVWACTVCNGKKSSLDESAKGALVMLKDSFGSPAAIALEPSVMRSMGRLVDIGRTSPNLEAVRGMKPTLLLGADGTAHLKMEGRLQVDVLTPWIQYVVRGLTVACTGQRIPTDADVSCEFIKRVDVDRALGELPFAFSSTIQLGNHTEISWRPCEESRQRDYRPKPGDWRSPYGAWWLRFFGGLGLFVSVLPSDLDV